MKKVNPLEQFDDIKIIKKPKKTTFGKVIYYILGTCLSLMFIFPILYMLAASTKSEEAIAKSAGTLLMFVPDFSNIGNAFDNYRVIFGEYNVG